MECKKNQCAFEALGAEEKGSLGREERREGEGRGGERVTAHFG